MCSQLQRLTWSWAWRYFDQNHFWEFLFLTKVSTQQSMKQAGDLRICVRMLGLHPRVNLIIDSSNRSRRAEGEGTRGQRDQGPSSVTPSPVHQPPASHWRLSNVVTCPSVGHSLSAVEDTRWLRRPGGCPALLGPKCSTYHFRGTNLTKLKWSQWWVVECWQLKQASNPLNWETFRRFSIFICCLCNAV